MGKYATANYIFQPGETKIRPQLPKPGFAPQYRLLLSDTEYDEVMSDLDKVYTISFDTETTSLHIDELVLVSFSFSYDNKNWVCLVNHETVDDCYTDLVKLTQLVYKILTRPVVFLFNSRFDTRVAHKSFGIDYLKLKVVDVQSLIFIADSNQKMPALKPSEFYFLGVKAPDFSKDWLGPALQHAPVNDLALYSAYDSWATLQLGLMFYQEISSRYPLISQLDRRFIPALMWYEDSEFDINREHLVALQQDLDSECAKFKEKIFDAVGIFLLSSTQQLAAKLKSLGYDTGVKTKTGAMSTGIDALMNLEGVEFVEWIIKFKKLTKLNNSYVQPMLKRLSLGLPFRFHYILNNAPTMRLAAGSYSKSKKKAKQQMHHFVDINFQSISKPKMITRRVDWDPLTYEINFHDKGRYLVETGDPKLNLRKSFVPPNDDFLYYAIDYAGQELKIAANLSGEPVWIDAFLHGRDVHKETAIKIWGAENYDKNKRKKAKIANFGVLYGGSEFFLMQKLKMTEFEAKEFIRAYRAALPTLFAWTDRVHKIAQAQGYIISPYGLPRRLSFYYRQGGGMARFADRSSVNTLVQGSAGVIIRLALARQFDRIGPKISEAAKSDFYGDVLFRGSIHDEIDGCCRKDRFREYLETIVPIMTQTTPKTWPVPMTVEVSVGNNWGEMLAIDHNDPLLTPIEVEEEVKETAAPEDADFLDEDFEFDEEGNLVGVSMDGEEE